MLTNNRRKNYNLYMKLANKVLMSKGMGKVLDSKISKKAMIPLGAKIIKVSKKILPNKADFQGEKDFLNAPGEKLKKENEMERTGQVAMRRKGRGTSDGYMRGQRSES